MMLEPGRIFAFRAEFPKEGAFDASTNQWGRDAALHRQKYRGGAVRFDSDIQIESDFAGHVDVGRLSRE